MPVVAGGHAQIEQAKDFALGQTQLLRCVRLIDNRRKELALLFQNMIDAFLDRIQRQPASHLPWQRPAF